MATHSHHGFLQNILTIGFAQSLRSCNGQYRFRVQAVELFPIQIAGILLQSRNEGVLGSNHYSRQWEIFAADINLVCQYPTWWATKRASERFRHVRFFPERVAYGAELVRAAAAPLPAELARQSKDGRYERGREIGRGGMGRILEAADMRLRRSVALKLLVRPGDEESQNRFIREARITGALQHPGIVPVHEINLDERGELFYTMKLVRGVTLLEIIQALARRDPDMLRRYQLSALLTIFQKVCDAIAFAHSQPEPVIHRDLKPENIMVGNYGEVLVMDWGAAKILRSSNGDDDSRHAVVGNDAAPIGEPARDALLTQAGSVIGTPGYMAPEQARGQTASADERTDIYALGGILYALLTWEAPVRLTGEQAEAFDEKSLNGEHVTHVFHQHVAPLLSNRSAPQKLARPVPDSLVAVVLKSMSFRPEDRFQSVKELQADVAAYQTGRATSAEQAGAWKHFKLLIARNKTLFSTIASIFVILLGATGISLYERQAALKSNQSLQLTLHSASQADHETAHQRFRAGAWREGLALVGRSLIFWPENQQAANYLLSAIAFGHGDGDTLPIFGVYHDGEIIEADFSPDGLSFVTASHDGTAQIWDSATGTPVGKPLRHSAPLCSARFSPDGRKIVTTNEHGSARVWDTRTRQPLTKPMLHGKPKLDALSKVEAAVFSPDGHYIVTTSYDHTTRVWDAETGEQITELLNPNRASEVVFSPDGTRILGSCWRGATLWDARTFQQIGPFMNHGTTVKRSMFTPDGNKIVTGDLKKKVRIWDGHTAQPLIPFINASEPVWDLDVSPDGKLFATAGWDKTARLWSFDDGTPKGLPMEHQGPVDSAIFSSDGKRLLTSSRDKTVRIWDVATCKQIGNPMRHDETVLKAIFSPDGRKILSVGADRAGYVWDAAPPHWPGEVIPTPGEICSVEFDKSNDGILVATRDGEIGLWSLEKNQFVTSIIRQGSPVAVAGFHVPSRQIATADNDGIIRFWDVVNGKRLGETAPAKDRIVALKFAADGRSVFAAHHHGTVSQWKIPEGTQVGAVIKLSENMDALAIAPKGNEIATGAGDDLFQFWEPSGGKPSRKDIRHSTSAIVLNYHPGGHLIAAGCEDHTARIWSLDSGEQVGEPFYLNGRGTAVRFTLNGNTILVGGDEDTEVNCYDTKTHNSLCLPLPHPTGVSHITSNSDGSLIITVTNDGVARLWRIPTTSDPPPKWLPEYIRALGGLAFTPHQQLVQVSTRERLELRKKLLSHPPENSVWDRIMRWSFEQERSAAPDR